MDVAPRSRRRVDAALADLRDRYRVDRVVETEWPLDPESYDRTRERFEAGTVGGAGAWVARRDGAVLLVRERGREGWSEPSGKHEPGESLPETARREVREETGVAVDLTHVALAQRSLHVDRTDDDRPPIHRLVLVFGGTHAGGTATPGEPAIQAVRWFESHPEDLHYPLLADLPIPAPW